MSQPATVHILATDADVTVTVGDRKPRSYEFGLTGSELRELLEEIGVNVTYEYQEGGLRERSPTTQR